MNKRYKERMEERRRWEEKRKSTMTRNWILMIISLIAVFLLGYNGYLG
jgi:hypothetical protein